MTDANDIWVLADPRPGTATQALAVAEALGLPFTVKRLEYGPLAGLPNVLRGASRIGLLPESHRALAPPWPRLVVAAGRRAASAALWVKERGDAMAAQVMDPGTFLRGRFDLVAIPEHDRGAPRGPAIQPMLGAPHRITAERLQAARDRWLGLLEPLPAPRVALLVGGTHKGGRFSAEMARDLGTRASVIARAAGGSLMVTTSRRTGEAEERVLFETLDAPHVLHRWNDGGENPYHGFLAWADAILVTGDSVSMLSEACGTSVPVAVFAPQGLPASKHERLIASLSARGRLTGLDDLAEAARNRQPAEPTNAAAAVAARLRLLLGGVIQRRPEGV